MPGKSTRLKGAGIEYRISDLVIEGDAWTGYNISARVYHGNYGYININASDITFCDNGAISTGEILAEDQVGNTLSINFNNCDEYSLIYDGVTSTYLQ